MMFEEARKYEREPRSPLPTWVFLLLFFGPPSGTLLYYTQSGALGASDTFQHTVLVLNASVNLVIAYLTITIYGSQEDILDQADDIMDTMNDVSQTSQDFTKDIAEAKSVFTQVGVDLTSLDLEPVAEVVEKLKENKDGFSEVLDGMNGIDVGHLVSQAKGIDWQKLLDAAEEVMGFIESKNVISSFTPAPKPQLESYPMPVLEELAQSGQISDGEVSDFFDDDEDDFFIEDEPELDLAPPKREPVLDLIPPKRRSRGAL